MRVFFDKRNGKNVDISEFPFLFSMQIHQGWAGIFFSGLWFGILWVAYYPYWNKITTFAAVIVFVGFGAIAWLSTTFSQKIVDRADYEDKDIAYWDEYARRRMSLVLAIFSLTCSLLIWTTAGMYSPFIPFYIMVFTLALAYCSVPDPAKALLVLFVVPLSIAALTAERFPGYVDNKIAQEIKLGIEKYYVDYIFAVLSMCVPYASLLYLKNREKRRERRKGASNEPATQ